MSAEESRGPSGGGPEEGGEWLSVAAAARRLGVSPRAVRSRIERSTIRWRPAGNSGKLVWLTSGETSAEPSGDEAAEDELAVLRLELADAREKLTAALVAAARAEGEAGALRDSRDRERDLVRELRQELLDARKPWWRRWWSG
jgi:hypothetical protein